MCKKKITLIFSLIIIFSILVGNSIVYAKSNNITIYHFNDNEYENMSDLEKGRLKVNKFSINGDIANDLDEDTLKAIGKSDSVTHSNGYYIETPDGSKEVSKDDYYQSLKSKHDGEDIIEIHYFNSPNSEVEILSSNDQVFSISQFKTELYDFNTWVNYLYQIEDNLALIPSFVVNYPLGLTFYIISSYENQFESPLVKDSDSLKVSTSK